MRRIEVMEVKTSNVVTDGVRIWGILHTPTGRWVGVADTLERAETIAHGFDAIPDNDPELFAAEFIAAQIIG